jgi:hypothetical protein
MNFINRWIYLAACVGILILLFIITGVLDILIAVLYSRFYTSAAFVVSFVVGGIFATVFAYTYSIAMAPKKNEVARWSILSVVWLTALVFIFPMSALEGGEYKSACMAFGITSALSALLFVKGKVDV